MTSSKLFSDSIQMSKRRSSGSKASLERGRFDGDSHLKMAFIKVAIAGVCLLLISTLIRIQIFEGSYFKDLADGNRIRELDLAAPRGIILDRNDNPLVVNLPAYRLRICEGHDLQECTVRTISKDQAIGFEADGLKQGQFITVASSRSYPFDRTLAHLIGYVSEVGASEIKDDSSLKAGDQIGRGGVEQQFDKILRGFAGKEIIEVDAASRKLRSLNTTEPQPGKPVQLSVDVDLQKVAYEQVMGRKAAVVATDPKNGEILAMVSSPSFDPNLFTDLAISPDERASRIASLFSDPDRSLFNRAIAGTYPAGSTFKIITATAGLEEEKISEKYTIDDPGILIVGPYKFPNWKYLQDGGTQGVLNVSSALKVSNDVFFYKVGEMVGIDGLVKWALKYGLAKKTGIDLPGEAQGVFPTKQWRDEFARDWYLGDTYHLAIGQGDMLATPLQDNRWTSVIANDGHLCTPHVLLNSKNNCPDMGLHKKTLNLIKQGMIEACSPGGTAYPLFNFKDPKNPNHQIQIACKTGTAEFGEATNKTHAWLTAFAPSDNPTIVVTVILEAAGEGADVAAPVVKKMLEEWFSK